MRIFVFIILLFSFAPTVFAAELQQPTFDDLLQRLRLHPEIQAYVTRAASSQHYAQGELGLPDPMLNFQVQDYPISAGGSSELEQKMIGFKQEIPRAGIRRAKSEKMQVEAHKTNLMADYAFAGMKAQLITVLANRQSFKEQEKLLDEQESLFHAERKSIKGRVAADQSAISRVSMNDADSSEVGIMRAELMEQEHESAALLTNMLGEVPDIASPPVKMAAWDNDPEKTYPVKIAAEDVAMAQKEVAARTAEFGPNFEIQGNVGRMDNGNNMGTIMVGISIPLWSSESQRPRLEGANAALHSSQIDLDNVRRGVTEKFDYLRAQIATSQKKLELLKTKNANLQAAVKALAREYGAGKADFSMYIKARRDALSSRLSLVQERAKNTALIADFNHYILEEPQ